MTDITQPEALRLADELLIAQPEDLLETELVDEAAAELRRLHHNNEVLMNALWKACGDDGSTVNETIVSQGGLK